ncbi:MAG: M56 family metallopeptidase [Bacteroidota bacterium]
MEWLIYLLKVSACMALFFAFYLLVLRKLTFFKINRLYLLLSLFFSFMIPALQFTIEREMVQSPIIVQSADVQDVDLGGVGFRTPIVVGSGPTDEEVVPFNWLTFLPYIYSSIVAGLLGLAGWRLFRLLKQTNVPFKTINGLKLVAKKQGFTNCSFFNYVFIDENNLNEIELTALLAHERVHVKQYHSIDKLVLMLVKAFLWFNPIVYLYGKALEQEHEYEADRATSSVVGNEVYATLLLKLAVGKGVDPLLHSFVKNPIKQRIKMLFNSKSKKMKKLTYLLALPIGLGLIWGFTVKITHHTKPITQIEQSQSPDSLIGKTVKGKVIGFEKVEMGEVINLKVGNTVVPISKFYLKDKVKIGDEITVRLTGKSLGIINKTDAKGNKSTIIEEPYYQISKAVDANGKLIYERPVYAFLYEANRARFAWSTIKTIEKDATGTIKKIVLYDKGFTINLNVAAQKFKNDDFKQGDSIVVKFIGERLTGNKTYTTDKMIALYSWPKKYELINPALYSRFYYKNGKQKLYNKKQSVGYTKPVLLNTGHKAVENKPGVTYSATDSTIVNKAKGLVYLYGNAIIEYGKMNFKGSKIVYDTRSNTAEVKDAIYTYNKDLLKANEMKVDFNTQRLVANGPVFMRNL